MSMRQSSILKKKTTSEIICQNFKILPETIFQDYKCTLRGSVTFFGRLYIGEEHFLFISNMFGIVKKCIIDIERVVKVESQNQAGTSILVVLKSQEQQQRVSTLVEYSFGGFKNNNAEKLINALWKRQKIAGDILKAEEEELDQDAFSTQQEKSFQQFKLQQAKLETTFYNPQILENEKLKIIDIIIPCSIQKYWQFFLTDKATVYPRKIHFQSKGSFNIVITNWKENKELGAQVREANFTIRVVGVPFKSTAGMSQVWQLKMGENYQETGFQFNIMSQVADIPYASYFNCVEQVFIKPLGPSKCAMEVSVMVVFCKQTYLKGTILKRTYVEMREDYQMWVKNVNDIFSKMMKKEEIGELDLKSQKRFQRKSSSSMIEYEPTVAVSDRSINDISPLRQKNGTTTKEQTTESVELAKVHRKLDFLIYLMVILLALNCLQFFFLWK